MKQICFLKEENNYFYSYYYLLNNKINKNLNEIRDIKEEIYNKIIFIIDEKQKYFENISQNELVKLSEILNNIKNNKSIFDSNETLYLINNLWLNKAINFINNILNIYRNKNNNTFKQIFNLYQVYTSYFNNEKFNAFYPGPINNYLITDFKDIMNDLNIFEEENYIIKNNLKLGKDYSLMKENDWDIIKELFGETNEIKRKINNLEFLKIKALIFDKRIIKYNKMNYLKQKYINIRKNSSVKDFKEKILRCFNYIFENKNYEQLIKNEEKNKFINEKNEFLSNSDKGIEKDINNDNEITGNKTGLNKKKKDNNDNEIYHINFYKLSKNNKHFLIEILTTFINNITVNEINNVKKI